jgi:hypothetical protein
MSLKKPWSFHPMMLVCVQFSLVGRLPRLILGKPERTRVVAQLSSALPPGGIRHQQLSAERFMKSLRMVLPLLWASSALHFSCLATDVLTYHNDDERTGWNSTETTLTSSNVNVHQFGLLANLAVDAPIFAQPLYVSGVTVGGSSHNLLIVATENDSVYAFDANSFTLLWQVSLLGAEEQPVLPYDACADLLWTNTSSENAPALGITATPVISRSIGPNGTIYVLAMSMPTNSSQQFAYARLHALDLSTGQEMQTKKLKSPVTISATFPSLTGTITFNPYIQRGRPGLLLQGGIIYTGWGSQCDIQTYYGWIITFNAKTLQQISVMNTNPNQNPNGGLGGGGVWGSGGALAGSPEGSIYLMTGDGLFDTNLSGTGFPSTGDYGDAFMRVSPSLAVLDYFAPSNQYQLASLNSDLGSGGVVVLPAMKDTSGNTWSLAVGAGKDGTMYLANRNQMGKYNVQDQIYQEVTLPPPHNAMFSSAAYFHGGKNFMIYVGPVGSPLLRYNIVNAKLTTNPTATSTTICGTNPNSFSYPGATPSISSNGTNTSSAVIWAYQNLNPAGVGSHYGTPVLRAYDYNLNELYCSQENPADALGGAATKYLVPTVCNGEVFVGTTNSVGVFGLLPNPR